jgi:hypothetical protein
MGEIIFWTIIRTAIVIPLVWFLQDYFTFQLWFTVVLLGIYGVIIHPAVIHYRLFEERNKEILESTLCSSCRYFDRTAILCTKLDKHPSTTFLPCQGFDWEPAEVEITDQDID